MNSIREKNIKAIEKNKKSFPLDIIEKLDENKKNEQSEFTIEVFSSKSLKYTAKVFKEGKTFLLHSAYDPFKEALTLVKEVENEEYLDLVFVVGLGIGYMADIVRKYDISVAVIEPSISFFNLLIDNFDLENILSDKKITFFIGEDETKDIETFISMTTTKKVKLLTTRAYASLFQKEVLFYQNKVLDLVDKKTININTLSRFEKLWAYNIASNVVEISTHYGVNKFYGKYKDIPAVIVSAGPSLEKNILLLKEMSKKALIIAVDTAIKPMTSRKILPDFIITIDPQKKNSKYFRNADTSKSVLIAESSVDHEAIESFNGPVYFIDSIFPLAKYFMKELGKRGDITMGGSVSTAAFGFATKLECNPIIMVGLDLSFPNHQTHIKGSYHEENFFTEINKLDSYDSRIYKVLVAGNLKEEKNIYGNSVFIDSRFQMYRNWYESECLKYKDIKFYNATEGGVIIKNMENVSLSYLIDNLKDINIDRYFELDRVHDCKNILSNIYNGLKKIDSDIMSLLPDVNSAIEICKNIEHDIEHHRKYDKLLLKLDLLDSKLMNVQRVNEFIGITMQKTIKTLTEGFDLDISSDNKELKAIRNSLKLYEAMKDSVDFNHYVIERALLKIDKRLNTELYKY